VPDPTDARPAPRPELDPSLAGRLDNAVWHALAGPHAALAEGDERARRYRPEVTPFAALADGAGDPVSPGWEGLAALVGDGAIAVLLQVTEPRQPPGWDEVMRMPCFQMVGPPTSATGQPGGGAGAERLGEPLGEPLGEADVPEMLALVSQTRPGPFLARTIETGRYLGIRRGGRLVAMAGERIRLAGATEISAVCTDPAWRGHGLAEVLVRELVARAHARGDVPFLHVLVENHAAIRLYERLGFSVRAGAVAVGLRPPPRA
jgi:ribosomal protein S18 acetylase RimI-like enzyme